MKTKLKTILRKLLVKLFGRKQIVRSIALIGYYTQKIILHIDRFRKDKTFCNYKIIEYGQGKFEYFYGYYDLCPMDIENNIILSHKVEKPYQAEKEKYVKIGYFKIDKPKDFIEVERTNTWCWQQGCRLQWYPICKLGQNKQVLYNALVNNKYGCKIINIESKKIIKILSTPIYSVTSDGKWGLTLNFQKLEIMRPGYGYNLEHIENRTKINTKDDGIWKVNMFNGEKELLFSIDDIIRIESHSTMERASHYFNHISINTDDKRFLFFHVWVYKGKRFTRLLTSDLNGKQICALVNEGHVSHYSWISSNEILCYSSHKDTGMGYYKYNDQTKIKRFIEFNGIKDDGHPSLSYNRKFILSDTVADSNRLRKLWVYDVLKKEIITVGKFYSPIFLKDEYRCDLHPRWNFSSDKIIFDSAHEGKRRMYLVDFKF